MSGSSSPTYLIQYKYNDQGYRTQKLFYTFTGYTPYLTSTVTYELMGDKVVYETNGTYGIMFMYDYDGTLIGFNFDANVNDQTVGSDYLYVRNQMGDITHILDNSGATIVKYAYDAYGNSTIVDDISANDIISTRNPYTYRGYRFDSDINMYYLNSRYYDQKVGRFLNPDGLFGQTGDILSTNMYAYCANNPVIYTDITGYMSEMQSNYILAEVLLSTLVIIAAVCPIAALAIISGVASAIGQVVSNAVNGQPLEKNVVGALIGGTLTIALGPVGIFVGAAVNAGLNAFENRNVYNEDYSMESIIYQFVLYSASNSLARSLPFGDPLYSFVGYAAIDSVVYAFTDWAQKYVIDFLVSVKGVKR